jgi:eukaryotic-like serine/threonine-protein kinase
MFVDEATLSSKIHDPNVVHVEDLGNVGGMLFLAMEYVHGAALAAVLKAARAANRRLVPGLVAHIGAQIASGLHAAHETTDETGTPLGIVHRDVSPQNVLVAFKGHVKVIDFGVAKAYGKQHETNVGAIQGKLGYMPPEQARSDAIDRRADIYALGIVLWEMLAARRLFDAEHELALVERVRNPRVEPPSRFAVGIPPALDAIVMRMLAPRVDERPPTALDVKRMLLDAVPEARSVEAHDVAALMRALLPKEIEQQNKVLATLDGEGGRYTTPAEPLALQRASAPAVPAAHDEDPTTEKIVDPVEALHHLTVPAVVVSDRRFPRGSVSSQSNSQNAPTRVPPGGFVLMIGFVVLALVVALVLTAGPKRKDAATAFPEAPPLPSPATSVVVAPPQQPPPPTTIEIAEPPSPPPTVVLKTPPPPPSPKAPVTNKTKKPPPAPAPSSAPKKKCDYVGGLELCE